jgi:hypothetical protein
MQNRVQIVSILVGLALLAVIFHLIRKNKLQEKYSLLWIASALLLLALAVWRDGLALFARWVGIFYAPSALFLVALFCGVAIALHFSIVVSDLTRQNKMLAQEVAILREAVRSPGRKTGRSVRPRRARKRRA